MLFCARQNDKTMLARYQLFCFPTNFFCNLIFFFSCRQYIFLQWTHQPSSHGTYKVGSQLPMYDYNHSFCPTCFITSFPLIEPWQEDIIFYILYILRKVWGDWVKMGMSKVKTITWITWFFFLLSLINFRVELSPSSSSSSWLDLDGKLNFSSFSNKAEWRKNTTVLQTRRIRLPKCFALSFSLFVSSLM